MKQTFHPAKVGTIPSIGVWIKNKLVIGKKIRFREYGNKHWETGFLDKIDETGRLFISR